LRFFGGGGDRAACSAPRIKPLAQLDDVHSILRLSYETLKGLISLASRGVAKLTVCETAYPTKDIILVRGHNPRQNCFARATDITALDLARRPVWFKFKEDSTRPDADRVDLWCRGYKPRRKCACNLEAIGTRGILASLRISERVALRAFTRSFRHRKGRSLCGCRP
jgi:hypothetical protein